MLPAKRAKVDISKLTEEEQKLFRLYGKLPTHKNAVTKMQKDRKYFDSGDYALSKAGKAPQGAVGTAIPTPENIPHNTPTNLHATPTIPTPGHNSKDDNEISGSPPANSNPPANSSPLAPSAISGRSDESSDEPASIPRLVSPVTDAMPPAALDASGDDKMAADEPM